MPAHVKAAVSLLALIVGAAAWYLESRAGQPNVGYVAAGLAVFTVFAMWIFPEARQKSGD